MFGVYAPCYMIGGWFSVLFGNTSDSPHLYYTHFSSPANLTPGTDRTIIVFNQLFTTSLLLKPFGSFFGPEYLGDLYTTRNSIEYLRE